MESKMLRLSDVGGVEPDELRKPAVGRRRRDIVHQRGKPGGVGRIQQRHDVHRRCRRAAEAPLLRRVLVQVAEDAAAMRRRHPLAELRRKRRDGRRGKAQNSGNARRQEHGSQF